MRENPRDARVWRGSTTGIVCVVMSLVAPALFGAEPMLFPKPLHVTREIRLPLTKKPSVVEEYYYGNRMLSQSGDRVAVADYAKGVLTQINRKSGTYSITRFEEIAQVNGGTRKVATQAANTWRTFTSTPDSVAGRTGDVTISERGAEKHRESIRVTSDREITLSKAAAEVVLGIAWPNSAPAEADLVLGSLRAKGFRANSQSTTAAATSDDVYRLPLEQVTELDVDGETVTQRVRVLRVGNELPPPDLEAIPAGAKQVDSKYVESRRMLDELDRPPVTPPPSSSKH